MGTRVQGICILRQIMEVQTSGKPIDQLLEKVLCMNILSSDYFKELYRLKTYHEVIDEIYNQVDHVEPWMTGNCRDFSKSSFEFLAIEAGELAGLKRCAQAYLVGSLIFMSYEISYSSGVFTLVGFLYLRYAADPKTLWNWFEPYVKDEEEFSPGSNGQMTTMGVVKCIPCIISLMVLFTTSNKPLRNPSSIKVLSFISGTDLAGATKGYHNVYRQSPVKSVKGSTPSAKGGLLQCGLLLQYYFDTLFPRIPVPVMRQIVSNLEKMNLPTKHCGVTGESTRGSDDTARRPPSVKAALSVSFGQRAPHRASTRDSSPVRRTMRPPSSDRNGEDDYSRRSPSNRRSQSRDLSDRDYPDRDRVRERDRNRDREKDRDRDRGRDRDRSGDRVRERDRDRARERDRDRRYDYERRSGESSRRDYDKSSRDRRSRSRSRSQSNQTHSAHPDHHSSPHRDGNKEKTSASSNLAKLRDLYGDLSSQKEDAGRDRLPNRDSGAEEVTNSQQTARLQPVPAANQRCQQQQTALPAAAKYSSSSQQWQPAVQKFGALFRHPNGEVLG
ncbi:hypothetical protein HYC85_005183 [Camellia sinensis]|uniref:Pre-mRNA-splicing factor 38 n=1 Tax=Camellia sinensis TaxID=4442 RepID=A0A7J7I1H5_CAMSI|nr:hypothetical protein HYC85_005183 [Camellia sinensis]